MSDEILTRSVELRANAETGVVEGIAVPWDTRTQINDFYGSYEEQFERGSITGDNIKLFWQHKDVMGKVISTEDRDDGFWISAQISDTEIGRDARTLMKDGVIDSFSVGFIPKEHREEEDGLIVRTKVDLKEVSAVTFPAYADATINSVRNEQTNSNSGENNMTDAVKTEDFNEVRETVEDIERRLATFQVRDEAPKADNRSAGEVLKAIASGDDATIRAYSGGTTADSVVKDGWVGDLTRLIDEASVLRGIFGTGTLPAEGNFIEYAQLKEDNSAAAVQAHEGDDLVFGKVSVETKTAPVKTVGGYTQLSRQEIERSSVNILDTNLRAQAIALGKALNAIFRTEYVGEVTAQETAGNTVELPATGVTYTDWLNAAVDAAGKFQDNGLNLDALVVDKATFKSLIEMTGADGRPVFLITGAGTNNVGAVSVPGLTGELASIRVVLDPNLAPGNNAFVNKGAFVEFQSPVVRLQDDNIINLSKDFSLYTYTAIAHEIPFGIVPVVAEA